MSIKPAVLWVDGNISMQVTSEGDGVLHCVEGIVERPPNTKDFTIRQHCIPAAKSSVDNLYERDLFALIGVESWGEIGNMEAASTFTRLVVAFETGLDDSKASVEDVLEDYKTAIEAREFIGAGLLDSPRWDNVQRMLVGHLRQKCAEDAKNVDRLVELAELLKRANGPADAAQDLARLRWRYANIYDRVDLCQDRECRDFYERASDTEMRRRFMRRSLTSDELPELPGRKSHILGATLGLAVGLRNEDRFVPGVDVSVTAQIPEVARFTVGTNIVYDGYFSKVIEYGNGTNQSLFDMGLVISPYLKAGLIPWGEGASLDIGVRWEIFEAERRVFIDTPYTSPQLTARQHLVKTSVLPEIGWTIYPLENLSMSAGITIPTGEGEPMTVTFTMGMLHWFLSKN